jgi:hypothetical protein
MWCKAVLAIEETLWVVIKKHPSELGEKGRYEVLFLQVQTDVRCILNASSGKEALNYGIGRVISKIFVWKRRETRGVLLNTGMGSYQRP